MKSNKRKMLTSRCISKTTGRLHLLLHLFDPRLLCTELFGETTLHYRFLAESRTRLRIPLRVQALCLGLPILPLHRPMTASTQGNQANIPHRPHPDIQIDRAHVQRGGMKTCDSLRSLPSGMQAVRLLDPWFWNHFSRSVHLVGRNLATRRC